MIPVDPLCSVFMWSVTSDLGLFAIFATFGTAWWYFIGMVGWASKLRSIGRLHSGLAAALALFFAYVGTRMSTDILHQDLLDGAMPGTVIFQYALVGALCSGALASGICSIAAMFGMFRKPSPS